MKKFFIQGKAQYAAICAHCANCLMRGFANGLILADSNKKSERAIYPETPLESFSKSRLPRTTRSYLMRDCYFSNCCKDMAWLLPSGSYYRLHSRGRHVRRRLGDFLRREIYFIGGYLGPQKENRGHPCHIIALSARSVISTGSKAKPQRFHIKRT